MGASEKTFSSHELCCCQMDFFAFPIFCNQRREHINFAFFSTTPREIASFEKSTPKSLARDRLQPFDLLLTSQVIYEKSI